MTATADQVLTRVLVELHQTNDEAKAIRDPLSPAAVELHAHLDVLLDQLAGLLNA